MADLVHTRPDAFTSTLLTFQVLGDDVILSSDLKRPSKHSHPILPSGPARAAPQRRSAAAALWGSVSRSDGGSGGDSFLSLMLRSLEDPGRLERARGLFRASAHAAVRRDFLAWRRAVRAQGAVRRFSERAISRRARHCVAAWALETHRSARDRMLVPLPFEGRDVSS